MPFEATCPVCGSRDPELVVERRNVPVSQNGVTRDRQAALDTARGDLEMLCCGRCGFVFNAAFDQDKVPYGPTYDNNQLCSNAFGSHVQSLVRYLVDERGVTNCRIVEVGCGAGDFIRALVGDPSSGNTGYGFDPSYQGNPYDCDGRLHFEKRYYDSSCSTIAADVVVCRHVIEHVQSPLELLESVHAALAQSKAPRIFFETPCVEWILRNRVIWDFFYEHCSLFSTESLATAFERSGFRVDRVRHVFDGQYLLIEATIDPTIARPGVRESAVPALAREYARAETAFISSWSSRIRSLREGGKLALWGAGAKGVTFANMIDPDGLLIDSLVDINPNKQGAFVPGTGHPIVDYTALPGRGVARALLMNPNYRDEIEAALFRANVAIELIS